MAINLPDKYRPKLLNQVVGQTLNIKSIRYAIDTNQLPTCMMFRGPKGTGKTSLARIISRCLNCQSFELPTINPCLICDTCKSIDANVCPSVQEIDAASNRGIEDAKRIKQSLLLHALGGKNKVCIIDEFQMLSNDAFGALLKILEEPPPNTYIILCTTGSDRIPDTILSRCVPFEFKKLNNEEILNHLKNVCKTESIEFEEIALNIIGKNSKGGLRDALTLLEKAILAGAGKITKEIALQTTFSFDYRFTIHILLAILEKDAGKIIKITNGLDKASVGADVILNDIIEHLYAIYAYQLTKNEYVLPRHQSEEQAKDLMELIDRFNNDKLADVLYFLISSMKNLVYNQNIKYFVDSTIHKAMNVYYGI